MSLFILRDTKKIQKKKGEKGGKKKRKKKGKKKRKKMGEKKSFTENMGFSFVLFTAFLIPPPPWRHCFFFFWQKPTESFSQIWLQQTKYESRTS